MLIYNFLGVSKKIIVNIIGVSSMISSILTNFSPMLIIKKVIETISKPLTTPDGKPTVHGDPERLIEFIKSLTQK